VLAVLDGAAAIVVGRAFHREQGCPPGLGEGAGLGGGGGPGTDGLAGNAQRDAGRAEQVVQAVDLEVLGVQGEQARGDVVAQQGQGLAVGVTQAFEHVHLRAGRQAQLGGQFLGERLAGEAEHAGGGHPAGLVQVVEQAGQLDFAAHLGLHHLSADPTLADQQAPVDQVLDGPAHGGAGQAELIGQVNLVLEPRPSGQLTGLDEVLQMLRDLEVERDRAVPVHPEGRGGVSHGDLSGARRGLTSAATSIMSAGTDRLNIRMSKCQDKLLTVRGRGRTKTTFRLIAQRRAGRFRPDAPGVSGGSHPGCRTVTGTDGHNTTQA
jgi:hypothetical protein